MNARVVHGLHGADSGLRTEANACEHFLASPKQREMPFLQTLPAPVDASRQSVAMCHSESDAIAVSLRHRLNGHSQSWVARALGYSRSYFSELKTGAKPMPEARVVDFCHLTGTNLLAQYRALRRALAIAERGETQATRIERIARELTRQAA